MLFLSEYFKTSKEVQNRSAQRCKVGAWVSKKIRPKNFNRRHIILWLFSLRGSIGVLSHLATTFITKIAFICSQNSAVTNGLNYNFLALGLIF